MLKSDSNSSDIVDDVVQGFASEIPQIDPLLLETVCRLIVAGRELEAAAASIVKQFNFNYTDFDILGMLRAAGQPFELTPAQLSKFTMITSGAMTPRLDRLEQLGLIKRRIGEKDRRLRYVSLTEKGRQVIEEALILRHQAAKDALETLSPDQMRALNAALKQMKSD